MLTADMEHNLFKISLLIFPNVSSERGGNSLNIIFFTRVSKGIVIILKQLLVVYFFIPAFKMRVVASEAWLIGKEVSAG